MIITMMAMLKLCVKVQSSHELSTRRRAFIGLKPLSYLLMNDDCHVCPVLAFYCLSAVNAEVTYYELALDCRKHFVVL